MRPVDMTTSPINSISPSYIRLDSWYCLALNAQATRFLMVFSCSSERKISSIGYWYAIISWCTTPPPPTHTPRPQTEDIFGDILVPSDVTLMIPPFFSALTSILVLYCSRSTPRLCNCKSVYSSSSYLRALLLQCSIMPLCTNSG